VRDRKQPRPKKRALAGRALQLESLVLPNSIGGLKPGAMTWDDDAQDDDSIKRPSPLTIRLSEKQKKIIRAKAQSAGISVNRSCLLPHLAPITGRQQIRLNAQVNNVNQIAR
jgi:hypothetical protein